MFTYAQICAIWLNHFSGDREIHTIGNTVVLTNHNSYSSRVDVIPSLGFPGNFLRMPLDHLPLPNAKDFCWNDGGHLCPCQSREGVTPSLYLSLNHWTGHTWAPRSGTVRLDYRDSGEYAVNHHWLGIIRMKSEHLELPWNYYVIGIVIVTLCLSRF